MSMMSEPCTSGQPGRFVRRLEAVENLLMEYKTKCDSLESRCESVEKWKRNTQKWLLENFGWSDVTVDGAGVAFEVEKVEYDCDNNGGGYSSNCSEMSQSDPPIVSTSAVSMSTATNINGMGGTPIELCTPIAGTSKRGGNTGNGIANHSQSNGGDHTADVLKLEAETPEQDTCGLSIKSIRSLFESDVEIEEESIKIGGTPVNPHPAVSVRAAGSPMKASRSFANDDDEQLEPSVLITPSVSITVQKSAAPTYVQTTVVRPTVTVERNHSSESRIPNRPTQNGIQEILKTKSPTKCSTSTNGTVVARVSSKENLTKTQSTASHSGSNDTIVLSSSKSSPERIQRSLSPYKGAALIKPHRRKTTQSAYSDTQGADMEDDTPCDVCTGREPELGNEMIFCDSCNVCVHQACYGVRPIPLGKWLCKPCEKGLNPKDLQCRFCPAIGGALTPVQSPAKTHWAHVSCTLWIPEIKLGSKTTMEPVINIHKIPADRWKLRCSLCNEKKGACIQCQFSKKCYRAFHVTCAIKHGLEMPWVVNDALAQGCSLNAFCKHHSFGRSEAAPQKRSKTKLKRGVSKSPRKKRRVDPDQDQTLPTIPNGSSEKNPPTAATSSVAE